MGNLSEKLKSVDKQAALASVFFLAKSGGVYLLWKGFTYLMENVPKLTPHWDAFRDFTGMILAKATYFVVVTLMGYEGQAYDRVFMIEGTRGIYIGNSCLGVSAMAIFAGLIIAYPGPWKRKLWYIPLGMLLVQGSNLFRLVGLALLQKHSTEAFVQFNHGYTYVIITYSFIFLLVVFWFNKLADKK